MGLLICGFHSKIVKTQPNRKSKEMRCAEVILLTSMSPLRTTLSSCYSYTLMFDSPWKHHLTLIKPKHALSAFITLGFHRAWEEHDYFRWHPLYDWLFPFTFASCLHASTLTAQYIKINIYKQAIMDIKTFHNVLNDLQWTVNKV